MSKSSKTLSRFVLCFMIHCVKFEYYKIPKGQLLSLYRAYCKSYSVSYCMNTIISGNKSLWTMTGTSNPVLTDLICIVRHDVRGLYSTIDVQDNSIWTAVCKWVWLKFAFVMPFVFVMPRSSVCLIDQGL